MVKTVRSNVSTTPNLNPRSMIRGMLAETIAKANQDAIKVQENLCIILARPELHTLCLAMPGTLDLSLWQGLTLFHFWVKVSCSESSAEITLSPVRS